MLNRKKTNGATRHLKGEEYMLPLATTAIPIKDTVDLRLLERSIIQNGMSVLNTNPDGLYVKGMPATVPLIEDSDRKLYCLVTDKDNCQVVSGRQLINHINAGKLFVEDIFIRKNERMASTLFTIHLPADKINRLVTANKLVRTPGEDNTMVQLVALLIDTHLTNLANLYTKPKPDKVFDTLLANTEHNLDNWLNDLDTLRVLLPLVRLVEEFIFPNGAPVNSVDSWPEWSIELAGCGLTTSLILHRHTDYRIREWHLASKQPTDGEDDEQYEGYRL